MYCNVVQLYSNTNVTCQMEYFKGFYYLEIFQLVQHACMEYTVAKGGNMVALGAHLNQSC